jgi:hypothetical protein
MPPSTLKPPRNVENQSAEPAGLSSLTITFLRPRETLDRIHQRKSQIARIASDEGVADRTL